MKRYYFLCASLFFIQRAFAQNTIVVNGGRFGNQTENVSVTIYDPGNSAIITVDTIHSQSVQDILIEGNQAYVAAQDSIVLYDLSSGNRLAATQFAGVSTKVMKLYGNELLVGNWYGQSSNNLYIYNKSNLTLVDSIPALSKGVKSMVFEGSTAYIPQNGSTGAPNFQDTLGYIVRLDVVNRTILDTLISSIYTQDIGEILVSSTGFNFVTINSVSNTFFNIPPATRIPQLVTTGVDLQVSNAYQYKVYSDTLYLKMNNGIGIIDLNTKAVIDTLLIDTAVTAFDMDTINRDFYVSSTDFFSYSSGIIYDSSGVRQRNFPVASSPEVVRVYYGWIVGLEDQNAIASSANIYPNPAKERITIELPLEVNNAQLQIFNLKGQEVINQQLNAVNNQIVLNKLGKGMYIINLRSADFFQTQKLILD